MSVADATADPRPEEAVGRRRAVVLALVIGFGLPIIEFACLGIMVSLADSWATTIISLALVSAFAVTAVAGALSLCFGQRTLVVLGPALVWAYSASLVITTIAVWAAAMAVTDGPDSQEGPGAAALAFLVSYIVLPVAWALLVRHHTNRRLRLKEA